MLNVQRSFRLTSGEERTDIFLGANIERPTLNAEHGRKSSGLVLRSMLNVQRSFRLTPGEELLPVVGADIFLCGGHRRFHRGGLQKRATARFLHWRKSGNRRGRRY